METTVEPSFGTTISRSTITGGPVIGGLTTTTFELLALAVDAGDEAPAGEEALPAGLEAAGVVPPQAVSATSMATMPNTKSHLLRLIAVFFTAILL